MEVWKRRAGCQFLCISWGHGVWMKPQGDRGFFSEGPLPRDSDACSHSTLLKFNKGTETQGKFQNLYGASWLPEILISKDSKSEKPFEGPCLSSALPTWVLAHCSRLI